jgi:dienelactone hydrolase
VQSVTAAARTATFMLKVLPMAPSWPLDRLTRRPVAGCVTYPTPHGPAAGTLYRPPGNGPYPGVLICLGVVPFGVDHPQVPRLGEALARAGFAALIYWSPAMRDLRLDPEDIGGIATAYSWLVSQPVIDARRSGLIGTCVGGAFALMAAAQPAIRDKVAFVCAWAPFASMRSLARDIAGATTISDGVRVPWEVDQLTRKVFVRSLTALLASDEADRLRAACAERSPYLPGLDLSPDGFAIAPLLAALDVECAAEAVASLPPALLDRLDQISPIRYLPDISVPHIILAHDRGDSVIPIAESRQLRSVLAGRRGFHYTEFEMFKHLDPAKVHLPPRALSLELAKFGGMLYPIFRIAATAPC